MITHVLMKLQNSVKKSVVKSEQVRILLFVRSKTEPKTEALGGLCHPMYTA